MATLGMLCTATRRHHRETTLDDKPQQVLKTIMHISVLFDRVTLRVADIIKIPPKRGARTIPIQKLKPNPSINPTEV